MTDFSEKQQQETFTFANAVVDLFEQLDDYDMKADPFHSAGEAASLIWLVYVYLALDNESLLHNPFLYKCQRVHQGLFNIDYMDFTLLPDWAKAIYEHGAIHILKDPRWKATTLRLACDMTFLAELAALNKLPDPKKLQDFVKGSKYEIK